MRSNFIYSRIICIYFIKLFIKKVNLVKNIYLTNLERKLNLQLYLERRKFFIILIRKDNFIEKLFKVILLMQNLFGQFY